MSGSLRRTRIKFCGMTRAEDVELAVRLGVDAIGLILARRSPRRLDLAQARDLRLRIPAFVSCVALVMDADADEVEAVVDAVRPDLLQFHGRESAGFCAGFGLRYLKAIPMADPEAGRALMLEHAAATGWVLDSHAVGAAGGSGARFDWREVPAAHAGRVILAGGLDPDCVADAVREVRPYAVDVSSGIERSAGIKDADRMYRFVAAVRQADQQDLDSRSGT